ncbi:hypothetical protein BLL52_4068 [Rhodoferax antarcticus ANT.BR]|uniref:Uncharacterized protein n=1 Tax=Rhodoferax antarcticus ANT.BR TaxID=1111071 RepID=A0A1Q8Y9X6_9BURK|nr:hypothetical protein BLL52_4068 [Rhodoferax antarcticus ANT.BR]
MWSAHLMGWFSRAVMVAHPLGGFRSEAGIGFYPTTVGSN